MKKIRFSKTLDGWASNLASTGRGRKQALSVLIDSSIVIFSLWLAYTLRQGSAFTDVQTTWHLFVLLPLVTVSILAALGVYRWVVRSSNERLFRQLVKGSIVSAAALVFLTYLFPPDRINPRSLFIVYGAILVLSTCGARMAWRSMFGSITRGAPVAIYGAGSGGRQLVNLMFGGDEFRPVLFIDDNQNMAGSMVSGLPVLDGTSEHLRAELLRYEVSRIILAIPSLTTGDYHRKVQALEKVGLPVQTMPSISEIVAGTARPDDIRDISIHDILGRTEVVPDKGKMGSCVSGKVVMVTGGGGSIGSELCRQILALEPAKLIVLDQGEANLYHITEELNNAPKAERADGTRAFIPVLCSVTDRVRLARLMSEHNVDTVYHAAAYKHVPIIEAQPDQGVETNVFGTLALLETAIDHGVADFLLVSTDKAVRPANAMGASKRVAELVLQAKAQQNPGTRISMVRFGNVLGSSGSVVPKFKSQIVNGGPITLTHPDITRYFMTIPEAAQLVLQASSIAKGGDVFVLDMGEAMRIEDLAITMVRLYGKKLRRDTGNPNDIEIRIAGLRPGEKMYEELFLTDGHTSTEVPKVFAAQEAWLPWNVLEARLGRMRTAITENDADLLRRELMALAFMVSDAAPAAGSTSKVLPETADVEERQTATAGI